MNIMLLLVTQNRWFLENAALLLAGTAFTMGYILLRLLSKSRKFRATISIFGK
jgi:hypothetical protein